MSETTRPILGHLTDSWAPPASCLSVQVGPPLVSPWGLGYQGKTCIHGGPILSDDPDCWPPRTANAPNPPPYTVFNGWGFYSPGTLCPSGFTTACTATFGQTLDAWLLQFKLTAGETAAGCCPSGVYGEEYSCANWPPDQGSATYEYVQTCVLVANPTSIDVHPCEASTNGVAPQITSQVPPYTTTIITGSVTSTSTLTSFELHAPLIQINWRAEDLATQTSIPTSTSSPSEGSSISSGAVAGIVIGAVVCLASTATGMFWYVRKRRTKGKDDTSKTHQLHHARSQQQLPSAKSQPHTSQPLELLTTEPKRELPAGRVAHGGPRVELQG